MARKNNAVQQTEQLGEITPFRIGLYSSKEQQLYKSARGANLFRFLTQRPNDTKCGSIWVICFRGSVKVKYALQPTKMQHLLRLPGKYITVL